MMSVLLMVAMLFSLVGAVSAVDEDDFDPALDLSLWALIQNGVVDSVPCGFVSSPNALQMNGGPQLTKRIAALIPGDVSDSPRIAQTVPLDVSGGGSIEFDYIQPGTNVSKRVRALGGSECEGTNSANETISLEYSVNGGPWQTLQVLPLGLYDSFGHLSIPIPAAAQTGSTAFRWIQYEYSSGDGEDCCDFWALDNVVFPTGSSVAADGSIVGPPCNNLFDGRINDDQALDCGAPVAIYYAGDASGRIDVYAIDPNDGDGVLIISVPAQVVESTPTGGQVEVSGNYLLGSAVNPATGVLIELYWLPATGEYLLRTTYSNGKLYEIIWSNADDLRHTSA